MKADVLTVAVVVFVVGILVSALDGVVFQEDVAEPPSELQQGMIIAQK